MRRRTFLATSATSMVALAGCSSDGSGEPGGSDPTEPPDDADNEATTETSGSETVALEDAAIARDLDAQPTLGPDPMTAESVIVEVTDPTCPTCRSFHGQAFPTIKSELVEPERTAFAVRNVDWVYPWAGLASQSLEAVHDREPSAYWDLLAFYFANQGDLTSNNVLSETESHLADTAADGSAVVEAVEAGEYAEAVAADGTAASDAGAGGQPYFFLFRDGELRTSFQGAQSYNVFASSLGY